MIRAEVGHETHRPCFPVFCSVHFQLLFYDLNLHIELSRIPSIREITPNPLRVPGFTVFISVFSPFSF